MVCEAFRSEVTRDETVAEGGFSVEIVGRRLTGPTPSFDGEFVRTAGGERFTLVHQYNRVPEWHSALRKKYAPASIPRSACAGQPGSAGCLIRS